MRFSLLTLYIYRAQLKPVSFSGRCQHAMAPPICCPHRRLSPHPDAPVQSGCDGLSQFFLRGHRRTLCVYVCMHACCALALLGPNDNVRCYWCGGSLKSWKPTDQPVSEHFRWFPGCRLSQQQQIPSQSQLFVSIIYFLTAF